MQEERAYQSAMSCGKVRVAQCTVVLLYPYPATSSLSLLFSLTSIIACHTVGLICVALWATAHMHMLHTLIYMHPLTPSAHRSRSSYTGRSTKVGHVTPSPILESLSQWVQLPWQPRVGGSCAQSIHRRASRWHTKSSFFRKRTSRK